MHPRPAPSVQELRTLLNRRVLMNADERMTVIFEGLWLNDLSEDLTGLSDGPEDEVARRTLFNVLTKGG